MAAKNNGRGAAPDTFKPFTDAVMAIERARPRDVPNAPSQNTRPNYNIAPVLPQVPPRAVPTPVIDVRLGRKTQSSDPRA